MELVLISAIALLLIVGVLALRRMESKDPPLPKSSLSLGRRIERSSEFIVVNYLLKPIRVDIAVQGKEIRNLIERIEARDSAGLSRQEVIDHLQGGDIIRVSVLERTGPVHFSDYLIDTPERTRIKALYVGMITTRYIGGSMDSLKLVNASANAGMGSSWVIIHNPTNIPLRLNQDVVVAPHCTFRYMGYLNEGVTLGTIFKDQDGLYPDYQYLKPYNHLYYGISSDIQQPLNGCFQSEYYDDCEYGQTLWPFQDGVY